MVRFRLDDWSLVDELCDMISKQSDIFLEQVNPEPHRLMELGC